MDTTRKCCKCLIVKSLDTFSWANKAKGIKRYMCSECRKVHEKTGKVREPGATKECTLCGKVKPSTEFGSHVRMPDGKNPRCFICTNRTAVEARSKWTEEEWEANRANNRERSKTPAARESQAKGRRKYKEKRHPLHASALGAVRTAVYNGKMKRPAECESNGKYGGFCQKNPLQPHHYNGYEREHWLDVEWLCWACHRRADKVRAKNAEPSSGA
jgi:hypothetical protein